MDNNREQVRTWNFTFESSFVRVACGMIWMGREQRTREIMDQQGILANSGPEKTMRIEIPSELDVPLRKSAEELLRAEHNALQNAASGIAIATIDGCLDYVNPALLDLWGYEASEELVGREVWELWAVSDGAEAMMQSILEDHQSWKGELVALKKDGTEFPVHVAAACNRDSGGDLTGMVFSFADITDRRRAEEAQREADRQKAMLATVGAACHHLGQPATVLMANLGLMARRIMPNDHEFKRLLQSSQEAAEELGRVLYELNTISDYKTTAYLPGENAAGLFSGEILDLSEGGGLSPEAPERGTPAG